VSALIVVVLAGGIGVSYWLDSESRPGRDAVERLPVPKAADPIPDIAAGSDQRPFTLRRQLVYYRTTHPPGSIIISRSQKFLYLVRPNVVAMRYSIGIGSKCADSAGLYLVSAKEEFPGWDDPVPSGQIDLLTRTANPLGARALYLERDERRIHGISRAIGMGSSLSCFQLVNDDVIDLFERVPIGTRVVATN
jgi:lipoprotein-anchoring transpeptidase ErfK/SrfK